MQAEMAAPSIRRVAMPTRCHSPARCSPGYPQCRVAGKGAGAGMLRNIPLMLDITRAVVDAVRLPVTVKTRLGCMLLTVAWTLAQPRGLFLVN